MLGGSRTEIMSSVVWYAYSVGFLRSSWGHARPQEGNAGFGDGTSEAVCGGRESGGVAFDPCGTSSESPEHTAPELAGEFPKVWMVYTMTSFGKTHSPNWDCE